MSYGISQNLMYGLVLTSEQSQRLRKHILLEFNKMKNTTPNFYSAIEKQVWDHEWDEELNMVVPTFFNTLGASSVVKMIAEDSDSSVHNTTYEDGFEHGFGVLLIRKGYGSHTTSSEFSAKMSTGPTQQEIDDYTHYCQPLLDAIGVTHSPLLHVVSYMA